MELSPYLTLSRIGQVRVSEYSPAEIHGIKIWIKSNTGLYQDSGKTTPVTTDGDPIGCVADQSGNGLDLSASSGARRPTYKVNIKNGYPSIRTDGVDDSLTRAFTWNQPEHIFIVWKPIALPVVYRLFGSNTALNWSWLNTFGNHVLFAGATGCAINTYSAGAWNITEAIYNGASSIHRRNDASDVTGNPSTTNPDGFTLGDLYDGASSGVNADILEVIGYSSVIAAGDRIKVREYLNVKYAIF